MQHTYRQALTPAIHEGRNDLEDHDLSQAGSLVLRMFKKKKQHLSTTVMKMT